MFLKSATFFSFGRTMENPWFIPVFPKLFEPRHTKPKFKTTTSFSSDTLEKENFDSFKKKNFDSLERKI
jgi:hypothetical protein